MKLKQLGGVYLHWCPACEEVHQIPVGEPYRVRWEFNGDHDAPTFTPSVRIRLENDDLPQYNRTCHYNITAGQIQFHADCTHKLAGQLVALPSLPDAYK